MGLRESYCRSGTTMLVSQVIITMYLDSIEHGASLLQRNRFLCLKCLEGVGNFREPFVQLLHHFSVVLPLTDEAVDDPSPLLGSSHHALPLVTQESQLHVELVSAKDGSKTTGDN